jgi:hypothetical protein
MAYAINLGNVRNEYAKWAGAAVRPLLVALVIVCVFDPADQILGVKVWLFATLWIVTLAVCFSSSREIHLPIGLLIYVLLFIGIPLLSIGWYYLANGEQPYHGFNFLKGYLLASLAVVLAVSRVDLVPILSAALAVLALVTIAIYVLLLLKPELFVPLYHLGENAGVMNLGKRIYGDLVLTQVNLVTAPMLAISIPYYFDRAMTAHRTERKFIWFLLTAICIVGMLLTGLRNTIAVALLLPCILWPLYTRRAALNGIVVLGALAALALLSVEKLKVVLDPEALSNSVRLTLIGDYAQIFSEPMVLLFGQGLGAYHLWSTSGRTGFELTGENFYFNTELTYAEMIRYFGLPGAAIMVALLLYPVAHAFLRNADTRQRALALGFLAYLGMSASNPLLFSSSAVILLSALVANTFRGPA